MAPGSNSLVCACRVSVVSALAAAVSDLGFDVADHRLERQHYPGLRHVALERSHGHLGNASCLGNARGIRMRGNGRFNSVVAPHEASLRTEMIF